MTASVLQRGVVAEATQGGLAPSAPAPASVGAVYEANVDYVFRCLRSLGVSEALVEDAVQDVFLVVHDKLHAFDGGAQLRTWLYAIVLRVARRYRERRARELRPSGDEPVDPTCVERTLLSHEALALARQALAALSDEKREVFVMAEVEQLSAPEIATITFTPLNTVYSRLRAARVEFARRVEQLARDERRRLR